MVDTEEATGEAARLDPCRLREREEHAAESLRVRDVEQRPDLQAREPDRGVVPDVVILWIGFLGPLPGRIDPIRHRHERASVRLELNGLNELGIPLARE